METSARERPELESAPHPDGERNPGSIKATVMLNATKSLDHRVAGTGFRTNSLRYRSAITGDTGPRIGETFLLNTQLRRGDRETEASVLSYYEEPIVVMIAHEGIESVPAIRQQPLPRAAGLPLRLDECFSRRRSRRAFTGDPIQAAQLAAIIRAAAGVTGRAQANLPGVERTVEIPFRSSPSPGGLYAVDLYACVQRVDGIAPGLYRYLSRSNQLCLLQEQSIVPRIRNAFSFPDELISLSKANAVFVLILRPQKLMRKYGDRAVRYAFIEAGAMTQNIHLAVTSLGFGSVECAGFYDGEMLDVLGLDVSTHAVLHTVLVGVPPSEN